MSISLLKRYGGWATLVASSLEILGLVFLILFFALELPQGPTSTLRFGFLSDVTPIVAAPVVLVMMVLLFLIQRREAPQWSTIAALLGIAGTLVTAWTNIMFVSAKITLEGQIQLFYISLSLLGPWHILVNSLARKHGFLSSRLTMFGILIGFGQLIMFILFFVLGVYEEMTSSNPTAMLTNIPLLISLAIGIPMSLIGYLGAPIWLVWLGRTLMSEDEMMQSLNELKAGN
jgi:hypothetical protein